MKYKLIKGYHGVEFAVQLLQDNLIIPFDETNYDFQQYLKWVSEGNTPEPADEAPKE